MVAGLLCISMLPVASSCNLFAHFVNFYANIKKGRVHAISDMICKQIICNGLQCPLFTLECMLAFPL